MGSGVILKIYMWAKFKSKKKAQRIRLIFTVGFFSTGAFFSILSIPILIFPSKLEQQESEEKVKAFRVVKKIRICSFIKKNK